MTERSTTSSGNPHRLREHPAARFALPVHLFDLQQVVDELKFEPAASSKGHRQKTLYRHGKATIALFVFDAGAGLDTHKAAGTVTIHVIAGRMQMTTGDSAAAAKNLTAGNILILAPGVEHSVHALEDSIMLLQVHLE